ncbi:hypothetical protein D5R40_31400 [Okeania hirsuta]|uniref:Uncharacterized protein n=1 Tax=Okeania hirsuta TaxID=1458930 RepID=A0A3N6PXS8_9CYAN|nr:hypothetical protein D5R40_31400 [Okeania hirsuta]
MPSLYLKRIISDREGPGGLLVPLNEEDTILDLINNWPLPVVLVSQHYREVSIIPYLVSICLKTKNIPLLGLILMVQALHLLYYLEEMSDEAVIFHLPNSPKSIRTSTAFGGTNGPSSRNAGYDLRAQIEE